MWTHGLVPGTYSKFLVDAGVMKNCGEVRTTTLGRTCYSRQDGSARKKKNYPALHDWAFFFFAGLSNSEKLPHEISA